MGGTCNTSMRDEEYEYEADLKTLQDERHLYIHKKNVNKYYFN